MGSVSFRYVALDPGVFSAPGLFDFFGRDAPQSATLICKIKFGRGFFLIWTILINVYT